MAFDRIRRRFLGRRPIWPLPESNELACLREIRAEMGASYPRVRVFRIARIVRRFGLRRLPFGLLVQDSGLVSGLVKMFRAQFPRLTRNADWHPLFASGSYLLLNPDVASNGLSPWLHFQVFGRVEGRSPHPFIDVPLLSASMPGVPVGEVLDQYLSLPERWILDPSSYIDCQKFLLSGQWDGRTNPLVQLVTDHLDGPWIHQRLMLVDTADDDVANARSLAAAVLITKNGSSARFNEIQLWAEQDASTNVPVGEREYTVIPGFFLGADGMILVAGGNLTMSEDCSMIRLGSEFIGLKVGEKLLEQELIYLEGSLSRRELDEVIDRASDGSVIAPSSRLQQYLIEGVLRDGNRSLRVLACGAQIRVLTTQLRVIPASQGGMAIAEWDSDQVQEPRGMAIVIDEHDLAGILQLPEVMQAIDAGATVCAVHGNEVWSWAPLLRTRALVVADGSLVGALHGIVDEGKLRRLAATALRQGS